jgi:hypothetical protein
MHAVANPDQVVIFEPFPEKRNEVVERSAVTELLAVLPDASASTSPLRSRATNRWAGKDPRSAHPRRAPDRRGARRTANLMLEDPALRTTIASDIAFPHRR